MPAETIRPLFFPPPAGRVSLVETPSRHQGTGWRDILCGRILLRPQSETAPRRNGIFVPRRSDRPDLSL